MTTPQPPAPVCDMHHHAVPMTRDGDTLLRDDRGVPIAGGPRYVCPTCKRRVYVPIMGV